MKEIAYDRDALRRELERDEGLRRKPYRDTVGKLTIGIGHNLEEWGLPAQLIEDLYQLDVRRVEHDVYVLYPDWRSLADARQRVLLNMAFCLGRSRFSRFKKFWAAVQAKDWARAGAEILNSKFAKQVGARADRLADMMTTGHG